MTSAQVVETSVTNNSSFQNYPHPDDHTIRTTFYEVIYIYCSSFLLTTSDVVFRIALFPFNIARGRGSIIIAFIPLFLKHQGRSWNCGFYRVKEEVSQQLIARIVGMTYLILPQIWIRYTAFIRASSTWSNALFGVDPRDSYLVSCRPNAPY